MCDWITTYFVSFSIIPGGIRLNLGYPVLVFLACVAWGYLKRFLPKRRNP